LVQIRRRFPIGRIRRERFGACRAHIISFAHSPPTGPVVAVMGGAIGMMDGVTRAERMLAADVSVPETLERFAVAAAPPALLTVVVRTAVLATVAGARSRELLLALVQRM